jgi:hypothetical protein
MSLTHRLSALALLALLLPVALAADLGPIGLTADGAQWYANEDLGDADLEERFAMALAAGDFNGDGADDLATGAPSAFLGATGSGFVAVRYGRRDTGGLVPGPAGGVILRPAAEIAEEDQLFGLALAAGDFDGNSFDDLAVGVPGDDPVGSVWVYYGSSDGLSADAYQVLDEASSAWSQHACGGLFGGALTVGNFDADPYDDLVIGNPYGCEARPGGGTVSFSGSVYVAHGRATGGLVLDVNHAYRISQDEYGMYDEAEPGDHFGDAVAAGDFNSDGYDDLAIGVPGENNRSGAIEIVLGSQYGLILTDSAFWLPGALGEVPEVNGRFGATLGSGDFDGDGFADLAVGNPHDDLETPSGTRADAGSIDVAYGAAATWGFDLSRTDRLTQGALYGNPAHDAAGDLFGWAIDTGDFDGDGRDDLAIGHHGDSWAGPGFGAVTVLMGDVPPLGPWSRHHLIAPRWDGVPGPPFSQPSIGSGYALAVGDFDGSGRADLAIGVPFYDFHYQEVVDTGAEIVLYSETKLFADGFESGDAGRWSAAFSN